jgi:hypothetical protein
MKDMVLSCYKDSYPKTTLSLLVIMGLTSLRVSVTKLVRSLIQHMGIRYVKDCAKDYTQCGISCVKDVNLCSNEIMTYLTIKLGILKTVVSSKDFNGDFSQIIKAPSGDANVKTCP